MPPSHIQTIKNVLCFRTVYIILYGVYNLKSTKITVTALIRVLFVSFVLCPKVGFIDYFHTNLFLEREIN